MLRFTRFFVAIVLCLAVPAGCDDGGADDDSDAISDMTADMASDAPTGDAIEVAGTWQTQFDTTEVITDDDWDFMSMVEFDNAENVAITQNPPDAMFGPDTFNRIHWTEPSGGEFYYCTVDFGLETADEARNSMATADEADLEMGCGGFAWTHMTAQ